MKSKGGFFSKEVIRWGLQRRMIYVIFNKVIRDKPKIIYYGRSNFLALKNKISKVSKSARSDSCLGDDHTFSSDF